MEAETDDEARREFRVRLGKTLFYARRKLTRFTQATIAAALGIDRETYGRWERGLQEPRVYDLARIWAAFGIPAEWLLDPVDSPTVLSRRVVALHRERQLRAALEAAQDDEGEGTGPADDGAGPVQRGRPRA